MLDFPNVTALNGFMGHSASRDDVWPLIKMASKPGDLPGGLDIAHGLSCIVGSVGSRFGERSTGLTSPSCKAVGLIMERL